MDCFKTFVGLSEEEVHLIDDNVLEKLVIAFDSLQNDLSLNKDKVNNVEHEKESATQEYQRIVEELRNKCSSLKEHSSEYEDLLKSTDTKYRDAFKEKNELQSKLSDSVSINNELTCVIRSLENEKEILSDQLKHKVESCDMLQEELKSLRAEADSVRKLKVDTLFRIEEVASKESSLKAQESRFSEEIASLQRHTDWLEERLRHTTDQLLTVRRDTAGKAQSLEAELDLRNNELENARKTISNLEESVRKLTVANEDYIQKVKQVAEEQIRLEQLYGNELEAQKRVVSLYKDQLKESEEKNSELTDAVTSMQGMLKSAYENVSRLEQDKISLKHQFSEEKSRLESRTEHLTTELNQSRQLLDKFRVDGLSEDELRQLNPAVAATLSALKRGHSLTQLYSDYVQLVEDRDQLRLDKQRLTEYVNQLVDDLKEKAPVLRDQQERYRKMESQVKELSAQLETVTSRLEEEQSKRQEMQRRAGYYQRATGRLKQTCADLSRQVQFLLREVEVLRGTVVEEPSQEYPDSTDALNQSQLDKSIIRTADLDQMFGDTNSPAGEVINEHLVTWRGLQDLQSQNQRLLCVARDLANQLEQREREDKDTMARVSELTLRVETLSGELDVVRMAAREARAEAQAVTRQRDMYSALLKHYDIEVSRLEEAEEDKSMDEKSAMDASRENAAELFSTPVRPSPGGKHSVEKNTGDANVTVANVERLEESLASLDAEFKRYREDKLESDKIYSTTVEQLRKESSEARLLNQKLAAQLDFTHEKLRIMEANVSGYKQEITVLREMNARYSTSAAASEAELARLREDLLRTSDKLLEVEVDARHSARQLEVARANETRWKQENEALRRQDQMHTQLMHQLEAIQGNLEQRESLDRAALERQVSQLNKQLTEAQSAFTEASQSCKTVKETLERELELARQNLSTERAEAEELRGKLTAAERELSELKPKKDIKVVSAESAEPDERNMSHELAIESASRIRELQLEVDGLRMRLDAARQQTEQMRALSSEAETRLVEATEENKQLEERLSRELNESKQRCEFLEAQLDLEKKERQNLVNENIRTTEEAHKMNADLRRELASLQSELESVQARCESALQLEAGAKTEIEAHERLAQEARQKYERELALHAQDVESLTEARKQADELKSQLNDLQRQCSALESKAQTATEELDTQNNLWQSERDTFTEKLQQADKDQSLLQEQLIKLTQQLVSLRKVMDKSEEAEAAQGAPDTDESAALGDLKTSEDLLQLVNYLRRQKSIAEASCDATFAENSRLLLRVASLEQQANHLRTELDRERKASELTAETAQRHSELMERVEQLNLVTESNRLLRHERETLRGSLAEVEKQLEDLRATVGPLRDENTGLQARVNSLANEHRSLEEERDRWKERCNRLVETAQRMDPEQYRLACNERDELQRKLRRTEEELHHTQNRLTELRTELDERVKKFEEDMTEANSVRQAAEKQCSEYSTQCDSLRKDLEARETTVVKLREIGRKYRQEAETLRRQLVVNQNEETHLQSIKEALTEAKADVVNLRSDLSAARTENSQLSADLHEVSQIMEELKSNANINTIMASVTSSTESSTEGGAQPPLVTVLRATFAAFSAELDRLHHQAEAQRERLLRLMLVESQLTKALRENTELRTRLTELQSTSRPVQSTVPMSNNSVAPLSEMDTSEPSHGSMAATSGRITMTTAVASDSSVTETVVVAQDTASTTTAAAAAVNLRSVPVSQQPVVSAWIVRASATASTMQSVPPTPSVTPPTSMVVVPGPKQTAEIRPITSNVATVIPTPAPQPVPTISLATPNDSLFAPAVQVSPSHGGAVTADSGLTTVPVVSNVHPIVDQPTLFRADSGSAGALRSGTTRRPGDQQSAVVSTSLPCGWLSGQPAPAATTSLVSASGKRRLDEANSAADSTALVHAQQHTSTEEVATTSVSSPDAARGWETQSGANHPTPSGFPTLFSEAKRPRQTGTTAPMTTTQSGSSAVVLGRPGFAHSVTPQATASRMFPSQTEHTEAWSSSVTPGVTGIVNPLTASLTPTTGTGIAAAPVDSSVSSSSVIPSVQVVRSVMAGESSEHAAVTATVPSREPSCVVSQSAVPDVLHATEATPEPVDEITHPVPVPESSPSTSRPVPFSFAGSMADSSKLEGLESHASMMEQEDVQAPEVATVQPTIAATTSEVALDAHEPVAVTSAPAIAPELALGISAVDSETNARMSYDNEAEAAAVADEGVEEEEGEPEEEYPQQDMFEEEPEPYSEEGEEEEEVEDEESEHEEVEGEAEAEEEDEDLEEQASAEGDDEVIELSSESENSEDGEENLEDYVEDDSQHSGHPDDVVEEEDEEEEVEEDEEEEEGDHEDEENSLSAPHDTTADESQHKAESDHDEQGAAGGEEEEDSGHRLDESCVSADDVVEGDEYAEHDEALVSQSHAERDFNAVEHVEEDSQLTNDAPTDIAPSVLSASVTSSTTVAGASSGSGLFSSVLHTPTALFPSTMTTTTSSASESKHGLFSAHQQEHRAGGLFGTVRPSSMTPSFPQAFKSTPFGAGSAFATENLPTASSAAGNLFRPSVLSGQIQPSPANSLLPKPSLFGQPATSVVSTEPALGVTTSVSSSTTADSGPNRPKIQPIVWDASASPGTSGPKTTTVDEPGRIGAGRRKKWGSMARTGLFSGTSSSTSTSGAFSTPRGTGASGLGAVRTKPHPRR